MSHDLSVIIVRTPTVFLINPLAPRERLETLRTKKSLKLHKVACEPALRGALAAGREKEGEVATISYQRLSTLIQRPGETRKWPIPDV